MKNRFAAAALLLALAVPAVRAEAQRQSPPAIDVEAQRQSALTPDPELSKRLDGAIDRAIREKRIVGTVVIVARDGRIVYHRAAGFADREARRPMREDNVFRLASLSKAIVSAAALRLVDAGKLRLSDPVTRWLPDFQPKLPDGTRPVITVRELITHTAGLNYGFEEAANGPYHRLGVSDGLDHSPVSLTEDVRRIAAAPLLYRPGTAWHYSLAIDVLGAVVAKAGGASLPAVVHRTVTGPLGMTDTAFFAASPARLDIPYADGKPQPIRMADPQPVAFGNGTVVYSPSRARDRNAFPSGGAGMVGTARDYVKFLEAIRTGGGPILRPDTARAMTHNQIGNILVDAAGPGWGWGLGFAILKDARAAHSPLTTGSYRWGGAYGASYWVDPTRHLTVVALTNTTLEGMSGKFPADIQNAVYDRTRGR